MKQLGRLHQDPSISGDRSRPRRLLQLCSGLAAIALATSACNGQPSYDFPAKVLVENDAPGIGYAGVGGLLKAPNERNDTQEVTLENGTEIGLRCIQDLGEDPNKPGSELRQYKGYIANGRYKDLDNVLVDVQVGTEAHYFTLVSGRYDAIKAC